MRWIPLASLLAAVLQALRPIWRGSRSPSRSASRRPAEERGRGRRNRSRPWRRILLTRGGRATDPDPFEVLRVQARLSAVADEVFSIGHDETAFARAHHLDATQRAYDALLAEACVLAGVATEPHTPADELERFREEIELTARGWSW